MRESQRAKEFPRQTKGPARRDEADARGKAAIRKAQNCVNQFASPERMCHEEGLPHVVPSFVLTQRIFHSLKFPLVGWEHPDAHGEAVIFGQVEEGLAPAQVLPLWHFVGYVGYVGPWVDGSGAGRH